MQQRFGYLKDRLFLLALGIYLTNRLLIKPSIIDYNWFADGYLNDMLLIPCVLPALLWINRLLGLRKQDGHPTGREIVLHLALWSVAFEWVLPQIHCNLPRQTGDIRDVAAYSFSACISAVVWSRVTVRPGIL